MSRAVRPLLEELASVALLSGACSTIVVVRPPPRCRPETRARDAPQPMTADAAATGNRLRFIASEGASRSLTASQRAFRIAKAGAQAVQNTSGSTTTPDRPRHAA